MPVQENSGCASTVMEKQYSTRNKRKTHISVDKNFLLIFKNRYTDFNIQQEEGIILSGKKFFVVLARIFFCSVYFHNKDYFS